MRGSDLDLLADALRDGGVGLVGAVSQLLPPGPLALAKGRAFSQEITPENTSIIERT